MGDEREQTFQDLMAARGLTWVKRSGQTKLSVDPVTKGRGDAASVPLKAQVKQVSASSVRRSSRTSLGGDFEAIPGGSRPVLVAPEPATGYEEGDEYFCIHGLRGKTWKKIKRNAFPHAELLDLHGYASSKAERKLHNYISMCVRQQERYAMIVHGKGIHSQAGAGVLRKLTLRFLASHPQVQAFCPAVKAKGGTGATYVRIKL